jgi:C-terminal processing protease CtpA/Prc
LNQLIASSLKGAIRHIDPYAEFYTATQMLGMAASADVPLLDVLEEPDGVLAVLVYGFHPSLKKQLRRLESGWRSRRPSGILLDVRGAVGDDYGAAVALAEWFLPRKTPLGAMILDQGATTRALVTKRKPLWLTEPMVVLIDRHTEGPAEFLAAALRDARRSGLVGESSRGMTMIQSNLPLDGEWIARLSTGRVVGPDGEEFTGSPLVPDHAIAPEVEAETKGDEIRRRGLAVLRERIANPEARIFQSLEK